MGQEDEAPSSEIFQLPIDELLKIFPAWESYDIGFLIDDIIEFYVKDEEEIIKILFESYTLYSRAELRSNLRASILELNGMQPDDGNISVSERTIRIPLNIEFFRMVFPEYVLMDNGPMRISMDIGVLKELHYRKTLEEIVRGTRQPEGIDATGNMEINQALHRMKIYSCPDADKEKLTEATIEGIKIFQKEYIANIRNQPIVEFQYRDGQLGKDTIYAMHLALKDEWTRELYFYYKNEGRESYVHDFVINNAGYVNTDLEIFAKEKRQERETYIGKKKRYGRTTHYGIQRFANNPCLYEINRTSTEKVIYAVTKVEGGEEDNRPGGYNAINAYDGVALSVGLFNWNVDHLWWLLHDYKEENLQNYNTNIQKYGLNILGNSSNKLLLVDGVECRVHRNHVEPLRKLKFVYCFVKAAEDIVFQEVQRKYAEKWLALVINYTVKNGRIRNYITSEHGLALVLDISVFMGRNEDHIRSAVNEAIDTVIRREDIADTLERWNAIDDIETKIINAFRIIRTNKMTERDAATRERKINFANLNKSKRSFIL